MKAKSVLSRFVDLIFPPRCVLCGTVISPGTRMCVKCEKENACVHAEKCIALPKSGKTIICRVPYLYQGSIRESIIRFKFYGKRDSAAFFGERIAEEFFNRREEIDFVTAVPISAKRKKLRGYNQSELVAREAASGLKLPYCEALEKIKDNPEQHKLSKQDRRRNVNGVYAPISSNTISGKRVLLIDDIVTTGATLGECAETLYETGAKTIFCAAIAEVERP